MANVENQTRGRDMGGVKARWEEWCNAVRHCIVLVVEPSTRCIVGAVSRGSGRGLGMGCGGNCGQVGATREHAGDNTRGEPCSSKEVKGDRQRASAISEAVSPTIVHLH